MTPVTRGRNDLWGGLILAVGVVLAVTAFAGVSLFQIGMTAFFTWLALARKQGWAWIPAAIFGFNVAKDLLDGIGGSLTFPLLVMAAGVLMLSRDRLSKNATVGILLLLVIVGLASNNRDADPRVITVGKSDPPAAPAAPKPPLDEAKLTELDLDGRDLVVIARDADVTIIRSSKSEAGMSGDADVRTEDRALIVDVGDSDEPIELAVPAESQVIVRTTGGDVTADLSGVNLDVDTVSGDLDIDLVGDHAITAATASGEIEADGVEDLDPAADALATGIVGSRVRLKTLTGSISISQT